jgi:hypothetical protein
MQAPVFSLLRALFAVPFLASVLGLGCAGPQAQQAAAAYRASEASASAKKARRGEDLRLLARLGGPEAIAALAGEWAHQTEARTRTPYDQSIGWAQASLRCAVEPDPVQAKGPPPHDEALLSQDAPAERTFDLERALYRLRITTPEARELLKGLKRCLPPPSTPKPGDRAQP